MGTGCVIFKNGSTADLNNVDQIIFNEDNQSVEFKMEGVASWVIHGMHLDKFMCTNCKEDSDKKTRFCPHCGFTMRNYNERLYSGLIGGTDDNRTEENGSC